MQAGLIRWESVHDLAAIVAGEAPRRERADQITLFKQNSDQGVGYMALARHVHELARRDGLGVEIWPAPATGRRDPGRARRLDVEI